LPQLIPNLLYATATPLDVQIGVEGLGWPPPRFLNLLQTLSGRTGCWTKCRICNSSATSILIEQNASVENLDLNVSGSRSVAELRQGVVFGNASIGTLFDRSWLGGEECISLTSSTAVYSCEPCKDGRGAGYNAIEFRSYHGEDLVEGQGVIPPPHEAGPIANKFFTRPLLLSFTVIVWRGDTCKAE
jgi:hypothetical protein